jgi:plasmid replication initiation protein
MSIILGYKNKKNFKVGLIVMENDKGYGKRSYDNYYNNRRDNSYEKREPQDLVMIDENGKEALCVHELKTRVKWSNAPLSPDDARYLVNYIKACSDGVNNSVKADKAKKGKARVSEFLSDAKKAFKKTKAKVKRKVKKAGTIRKAKKATKIEKPKKATKIEKPKKATKIEKPKKAKDFE